MADWQLPRFTITRFRPGYVRADVDNLIMRIEGTLGRAMPPDFPVTVAEVRNTLFRTTRLGKGYDELEVDTALERYEAELAAREGRG